MAAKTIAQLMEEARIRAGAQNYKERGHRPGSVTGRTHLQMNDLMAKSLT